MKQMTRQVEGGSMHKTDDVGGLTRVPCTKQMVQQVDAGDVCESGDVAGRCR